MIGGENAAAAEDLAAGREVGALNDLGQFVDGDLRIVEVRHAGVDDLAQIVGRNVGRHADGDAARAVDEQVRELRRQDGRFAQGAVVVLAPVDRVLVDVVEERVGDLGEAAFRVALCRRRIAVEGSEVALAVDQRQAHGEVLRHAHHGVVNGEVAVRMVFAHHLADDAGALHVLLVPVDAQFAHGVEDAPVHGLETVAHVGQRAGHDHAHGVVEVGTLHFIGDGDGADVAGAAVLVAAGASARWVLVVRHLSVTFSVRELRLRKLRLQRLPVGRKRQALRAQPELLRAADRALPPASC